MLDPILPTPVVLFKSYPAGYIKAKLGIRLARNGLLGVLVLWVVSWVRPVANVIVPAALMMKLKVANKNTVRFLIRFSPSFVQLLVRLSVEK